MRVRKVIIPTTSEHKCDRRFRRDEVTGCGTRAVPTGAQERGKQESKGRERRGGSTSPSIRKKVLEEKAMG